MRAAEAKSSLYKCAFSQERHCWRHVHEYEENILCVKPYQLAVHIARVSPIKVHLLKINQNKRIRIAYHIL